MFCASKIKFVSEISEFSEVLRVFLKQNHLGKLLWNFAYKCESHLFAWPRVVRDVLLPSPPTIPRIVHKGGGPRRGRI